MRGLLRLTWLEIKIFLREPLGARSATIEIEGGDVDATRHERAFTLATELRAHGLTQSGVEIRLRRAMLSVLKQPAPPPSSAVEAERPQPVQPVQDTAVAQSVLDIGSAVVLRLQELELENATLRRIISDALAAAQQVKAKPSRKRWWLFT